MAASHGLPVAVPDLLGGFMAIVMEAGMGLVLLVRSHAPPMLAWDAGGVAAVSFALPPFPLERQLLAPPFPLLAL